MAARKAFLLRLDPAVWAAIERLAQSELRSVNAQIEFMLRAGLARRGRYRHDALDTAMDSAPDSALDDSDPPGDGGT